MDRKIPKPGEIYDHFKDRPYQIITIATDSETREPMVVYQALYGDFKTYVRPLTMFMSDVDHEKYPDTKQKYRFEQRADREEEKTEEFIEKAAQSPILSEKTNAAAIPVVHQNEETGNTTEDEIILETPDGEVNLLLMKFLDAESYSKKLDVLSSNKKHLDDRLVTDMAVALDLAVDEGPLEQRIGGLVNCLQAMCRFEDRRLR